MPGPTNENLYTDRDLDEALDAARDQADAAPDEAFSAGWIEGVEFFHRYLTERKRLEHE
ncbi:hypothetical protein [Haloarcula pellucida]|uniref:Uncharacterized protein n=1 Tax=Haloarcula pellucida TaxID=1427151 RepID=A0A830GT71_9EURY|nr:hypothetical protein [Halomicroarcula pellucida]MBX0350494.1 hypothetical protein [Halomicroarcula pellucida]GGO03586.1 hypothetical protein GCM10009030_39400 [Halomicroarcula pellucida]